MEIYLTQTDDITQSEVKGQQWAQVLRTEHLQTDAERQAVSER